MSVTRTWRVLLGAPLLMLGSVWSLSHLPHVASAPRSMFVPFVAGASRSTARVPGEMLRQPLPTSFRLVPAIARLTPAERPRVPLIRPKRAALAINPLTVVDRRIAALSAVLRRHTRDRSVPERIARAILRESSKSRVDPALVTAIMLAENDELRPHARNATTAAQGLMQVMPGWSGRLGCASSDLSDIDANICHGVRVLALHLREAPGDTRDGLRRYNGCRSEGARCDGYPRRVMARAEVIGMQLRAATR